MIDCLMILLKDNKKRVAQSMLLCCKLFISESRNKEALESIEGAAKQDPETIIVNKFEDCNYNRVRYTLVSYVAHDSTGCPIFSPLQQTVVAMAAAAYEAINLEQHLGTHPRLGVVDDIVFHPLARASLDEAAWLAKKVASEIGNLLQGILILILILTISASFNLDFVELEYKSFCCCTVPVYLYAAAHPTGKGVDTIRRELGYFRPNHKGNQWAGWAQPEILPGKPNEGPEMMVSQERGIVMIGASRWVAAYNIPIMSTDLSVARRIALLVSARGGGLPTVQALGLVHGDDTTEVACLLLEPNQIGADGIQHYTEMLAAQEGLEVEKGYFTDIPPEMIVERYKMLISTEN